MPEIEITKEQLEQIQAATNRYIGRQDKINQILQGKDFILIDADTEQIISKRTIMNPLADLVMLARMMPRIMAESEKLGYIFPDKIKQSFTSFVDDFNASKGDITIPEKMPQTDEPQKKTADVQHHVATTSNTVLDVSKYLKG